VDFFETVNEHPARDGAPVLDLPVIGATRFDDWPPVWQAA
jgi:hypothetical protein